MIEHGSILNQFESEIREVNLAPKFARARENSLISLQRGEDTRVLPSEISTLEEIFDPLSDSQGIEAIPLLSKKEVITLSLAARGMSNRQIAEESGVKTDTIKQQLGGAYRKLDVTDRTVAVLKAQKLGYDVFPHEIVEPQVEIKTTAKPKNIIVRTQDFSICFFNGEDRTIALSAREIKYLQLIAEGVSYREIAGHQGITDHAVKSMMSQSVIPKLGARNVTDALIKAIRLGFIEERS